MNKSLYIWSLIAILITLASTISSQSTGDGSGNTATVAAVTATDAAVTATVAVSNATVAAVTATVASSNVTVASSNATVASSNVTVASSNATVASSNVTVAVVSNVTVASGSSNTLGTTPAPKFNNPAALPQGPSSTLLANIANQTVNPTNILANLNANPSYSLGSLYSPTQLAQLSPTNAISVLNGTNSTIDANSARALGPLLPTNTSFAQAAKVMSSAPIEILNAQNASTLIQNIGNVDFSNMDASRQAAFASKIMAAPTAANLQSYVAAVPANMINNIPAASFLSSGLNPFSLKPSQVPNSVVLSTATTQLASAGSLSNLLSSANSTVLALVSSALPPSQLSTVSDPTKIGSLMTAASSGKGLSSLQRKTLGTQLLSGAGGASQTSSLSTSVLNQTAELFIEQSNSVLSSLSNSTFETILGVVSQFAVTKCQKYSYSARQTFATQAANYLLRVNKRDALIYADLVSLGPCFAPAISVNQFTNLSYTDFYNGAAYFQGVQFQPNSTYISLLQSKISSIAAANTDASSVVSNLGVLSIFHPSLSTFANSTMTSYASGITSVLSTSYNLQNSTIQEGRVGVTETASSNTISTYVSAWQSKYVDYLVSTNSSSRRKRATNSITCTQLTNGPPYSFSSTYLSGLSASTFNSCIAILGATTNTYTTAQITALASVAYANGFYGSTGDSNLQSLGVILTGYNSSLLSGLSISASNTISKLGAVNSWSSSQITALLTAITNGGFSLTDQLSVMGNLICGYNSTTVSSLNSSYIQSYLSVLKSITNPNCASLSNLYSAVKSAYNVTTLSSTNLADFDGLIGGAPSTDLSGLGESFASITSTGIANLPASTINALPTTLFSYLTSSQLASFQNSPYYSSFSSSVTSLLSSAAAGNSTSTTSSSDSTIVELNLATLIFSSLMALFFVKLN